MVRGFTVELSLEFIYCWKKDQSCFSGEEFLKEIAKRPSEFPELNLRYVLLKEGPVRVCSGEGFLKDLVQKPSVFCSFTIELYMEFICFLKACSEVQSDFLEGRCLFGFAKKSSEFRGFPIEFVVISFTRWQGLDPTPAI